MRGRRRTWSDEALTAAVAKHTNITDVLRELGLRPAGGNHASIKRHVERLGLDTGHFSSERRVRGFRMWHDRCRRSFEDVFCEHSVVNNAVLRKHARRYLHPMCCSLCGNAGEWQGKPLTLQLDHANGKFDDNRLENLRWLCPNCHSQTETFAGRGSVRRARHVQHVPHVPRVRETPPRYRAARRPPHRSWPPRPTIPT